MRSSAPLVSDVVLIGGGHAHALALARWAMAPIPGARITLVTPTPLTPYTGMLPGRVAGHYDDDDFQVDLLRLARRAGARVILDRAVGLDLVGGAVLLAMRKSLAFDILSIDIGSTAEPAPFPGSEAHVRPVKPLEAFLPAWSRFVANVEAGAAAPEAAVIGGGVGGVEIAFAMRHRLERAAPGRASVAVIEKAERALGQAAPALRRAILGAARRLDVDIRAGEAIALADAQGVTLGSGARVSAGFIAAAAGARAAPWLKATGLPADARGFLEVGSDLRSPGDSRVFCVGDAAAMLASPRAKAGVFAVRQGPVLADNIARALRGEPLQPFAPQTDYLKLVSLGAAEAVAEKWGVAIGGASRRALWRWKDRIDRAFMARLSAPPMAMTPEAPPSDAALGVAELMAAAPLCAGCGSKVGGSTLKRALSGLNRRGRPDVALGAGYDAAALRQPGGRLQVLSVDHFKAFTEDAHLLARIAANHAMGDVWAMGGAPQAALLSITVPPMAPALEERTLAEALAGADAAFRGVGAEIVGGHSGRGDALSLGVVVTGLVDARRAILAPRPRLGDALVLTKPLGVGVILAAEMQGRAKAAWIAAAYRSMLASSAAACHVLIEHGARAMTDVTGFGLAGHAAQLTPEERNLAPEIDLDALPLLDGVAALSANGVRSSLYEANRADAPDWARAAEGEAAPLLFDPQTAGGLLAAVPAAGADRVVDALRRNGAEGAAIIGRVARRRP